MFLSILSFFYIQKYGIQTYKTYKANVLFNNKQTKYTGYDYRPDNNTHCYDIRKIGKFIEKKKLLDILENKKIPIYNKYYLLHDNSIKPPNLKAGGLINDFDD